jgi:hypothetical protein
MAAVGAIHLPVQLTVGDATSEVGTLVLHVTPEAKPHRDIRTELAALLRGVADQLDAKAAAEGVPDAAADR